MTNEEKAKEIIGGNWIAFNKEYSAAMQMAEWKDHQFKEYLEKKLEWAKGNRDSSNLNDPQWHDYVVQVEAYSEIISKLFPEQEQDNSNNDE